MIQNDAIFRGHYHNQPSKAQRKSLTSCSARTADIMKKTMQVRWPNIGKNKDWSNKPEYVQDVNTADSLKIQ